jgi:hypothetical protein
MMMSNYGSRSSFEHTTTVVIVIVIVIILLSAACHCHATAAAATTSSSPCCLVSRLVRAREEVLIIPRGIPAATRSSTWHNGNSPRQIIKDGIVCPAPEATWLFST